jgi:hypothetical protein
MLLKQHQRQSNVRRDYDAGLAGSDVARGVCHAFTVGMQVAGAGWVREGVDSLPELSHESEWFSFSRLLAIYKALRKV